MHAGFIVLFAMVVLWQAHELQMRTPACGYCNRRRIHARDCKLRKLDEK